LIQICRIPLSITMEVGMQKVGETYQTKRNNKKMGKT